MKGNVRKLRSDLHMGYWSAPTVVATKPVFIIFACCNGHNACRRNYAKTNITMLDGLEWIVPLNAAGELRCTLGHLFVERNPLSTLLAELHAALSFCSTYQWYQTRTVERVGEWTSEVHMSHTPLILCGYLQKRAAKNIHINLIHARIK